jgi:hypothetical protein
MAHVLAAEVQKKLGALIDVIIETGNGHYGDGEYEWCALKLYNLLKNYRHEMVKVPNMITLINSYLQILEIVISRGLIPHNDRHMNDIIVLMRTIVHPQQKAPSHQQSNEPLRTQQYAPVHPQHAQNPPQAKVYEVQRRDSQAHAQLPPQYPQNRQRPHRDPAQRGKTWDYV